MHLRNLIDIGLDPRNYHGQDDEDDATPFEKKLREEVESLYANGDDCVAALRYLWQHCQGLIAERSLAVNRAVELDLYLTEELQITFDGEQQRVALTWPVEWVLNSNTMPIHLDYETPTAYRTPDLITNAMVEHLRLYHKDRKAVTETWRWVKAVTTALEAGSLRRIAVEREKLSKARSGPRIKFEQQDFAEPNYIQRYDHSQRGEPEVTQRGPSIEVEQHGSAEPSFTERNNHGQREDPGRAQNTPTIKVEQGDAVGPGFLQPINNAQLRFLSLIANGGQRSEIDQSFLEATAELRRIFGLPNEDAALPNAVDSCQGRGHTIDEDQK